MRVSQLHYYPVKSLGVVSPKQMSVTSWGPHRDRRMMLVDEQGKFVTQRQCHKMAMMLTEDRGESLSFQLNGQRFDMPWPDFNQESQSLPVQVWGDQVDAQVVSDEASAWFSDALERPVTLVYMAEQTLRQVDPEFAMQGDKTGFSDGFPFLLISEASLAYLQSALPFEVKMTRFRPNIVVDGCDAFAEDSWRRLAINGIEFDVVKPCSRCVMPTINPENAERQPEVMQVLLKERKQGKKVYLGQNLIHRGEGVIHVGDEVQIIE